MKSLLMLIPLLSVTLLLTGCGSGSNDAQPKLAGPPDPRIKGPAAVGGGGGQPKGASLAPKQ